MTEQQVSLDHAAKSAGLAVGEGRPDVCSACEISRAPDPPGRHWPEVETLSVLMRERREYSSIQLLDWVETEIHFALTPTLSVSRVRTPQA